jgi:hypothetical protein
MLETSGHPVSRSLSCVLPVVHASGSGPGGGEGGLAGRTELPGGGGGWGSRGVEFPGTPGEEGGGMLLMFAAGDGGYVVLLMLLGPGVRGAGDELLAELTGVGGMFRFIGEGGTKVGSWPRGGGLLEWRRPRVPRDAGQQRR